MSTEDYGKRLSIPSATTECKHQLDISVGGCRAKQAKKRDNVSCLRHYQCDAINTLSAEDVRRAILNNPTGSGKTIIVQALAYLRSLKLERTFIVVPDCDIGRGYDAKKDKNGLPVKFRLPDGTDMCWNLPPENNLTNDSNKLSMMGLLKQAVRFVRKRPTMPDDAVVIITQALLPMLYEELRRLYKEEGRALRLVFEHVNIIFDEGHHVRLTDAAFADNADEIPGSRKDNKQGRVVKHYLEHNPGRLLFVTATFFRSDAMSIVPQSMLSTFKCYEYPFHQYLAEMRYLRKITFKISILSKELSSESLVEQELASNPHLPTMLFLEPVGRGAVEGKWSRLASLKHAAGPYADSTNGATVQHTTAKGVKIHSLDLVSDEGRKEKRNWFAANRESIGLLDLIWLQNLGREGFDWPRAQRAIVFGARKSPLVVVQMLGRLLRDVEDKEFIEFHIVLQEGVTGTLEEFEDYTGTILMLMTLGWLCQADLVLPYRVDPRRLAKKLTDECHKAFLRGDNSQPADEQLRGIIDDVVNEFPEATFDNKVKAQIAKSFLAVKQQVMRMAISAYRGTPAEISNLLTQVDENSFTAGNALWARLAGDPERLKAFRIAKLGRTIMTVAQIGEAACIYARIHGTRPTHDVPGWDVVDRDARSQGTTLAQICNDRGIAGGLNTTRTLEEIKNKIRDHLRAKGFRPIVEDGEEWAQIDSFLKRNHKMTLKKLCDQMNLAPHMKAPPGNGAGAGYY